MPFATDNPPEGHSTGGITGFHHQFMSVDEMKERIASLGKLKPCSPPTGNGPAKYFRLPQATGTIGFISPVSQHFCFNCNRLRLTAEGKLRLCLLSDEEIDLRQPLRNSNSSQKLKQILQEAVARKPKQHNLAQGSTAKKRFMAQVGG